MDHTVCLSHGFHRWTDLQFYVSILWIFAGTYPVITTRLYILVSGPLFDICSQKYKNLNTKFWELGGGGWGILQLSLQRACDPTISAVCYDNLNQTSITLLVICEISGFQRGIVQTRNSAEKPRLEAICHKTQWSHWVNSKNIWGSGCQISAPVVYKQWLSESKKNSKTWRTQVKNKAI